MDRAIGVVLLLIVVLLVLTACTRHAGQDRVITVPVPVETAPVPPPELLTAEPPPPTLRFVAPAHPQASSALTPAGERDLRDWVERLRRKLRAWERWAEQPVIPAAEAAP
jgi:hypothetical protein